MNEASPVLTRHKLTYDAYFRMAELGIVDQNARIELLDGEIIDMSPIGRDHAATVDQLTEIMVVACLGRAIVSVQNSLKIDDLNAPEPDLVVYRRRADYYRTGEPRGPADVLLVVEVANTSLRVDQTIKLSLYAAALIPEYWIVDLTRDTVTVHRDPAGGSYTTITTPDRSAKLALAAAADIVIELPLLLG